MGYLTLIEAKGANSDYVQGVAREHGFDIREENLELCVIKHGPDNRIVAVLGFNSDAGTDYHTQGNLNITLEHERLHMEPQSFISKDDIMILEDLPKVITRWVYNYLLRSAVASAPLFKDDMNPEVFEYGFNKDVDNIMQWAMKTFDRKMFMETLDILGYSNKQFWTP